MPVPVSLRRVRGYAKLSLRKKIDEVLEQQNGVALSLPAGKWTLFYEQFDAPEGKPVAWYRNIVLKWEPIEE
jgi:hypothetical protein